MSFKIAEYLRSHMGIKNTATIFQRLMDTVVKEMLAIETFLYLDDVIINSETLEEHDKKTSGSLIASERLTLNSNRTSVHLRTPQAIWQFLGLSGYYRKIIENYAKLAKPLTDLLKN